MIYTSQIEISPRIGARRCSLVTKSGHTKVCCFLKHGEGAAVRGMNPDTWNMSVATGACHGDFRAAAFLRKGAIS